MVHTRSPREVNKISRSCQIVADTLIMLEPHVVPGARVYELDQMAEDFIRSQGARPAFKGYMGFPATLCVSIDDAVVHGIPGEEILTEGQIVGIDCGAELDSYYGDHARSFAVGTIDADKQKLLDVTHESRSEEHTSELQSQAYLVCRLLLEKKKPPHPPPPCLPSPSAPTSPPLP